MRFSIDRSSYAHAVGRTAAFNLATTAISASTAVLLARILGAADRGIYAAVTAFFGVLLILFELGLGSSIILYASRARSKSDDYVRTGGRVLVPLAILAAATATVVGLAILPDRPVAGSALEVLSLTVLASFAGVAPIAALLALDLIKWNLVRLCQSVMFCLLVLAASLSVGLSVALVINLLTVALTLQSLLAWWFYLRIRKPRGEFRANLIKPMLKFGTVNTLSTMPNALNSRVDILVLAFLVPAESLGQYAVAVSLTAVAGPLIAAFGNVAFPSIARGDRVEATVKTAIRGSLGVSVAICAIVAATGHWLIPFILGNGFEQVPTLLLVLFAGTAVVGVNQVLGDILRGLGRPGVVASREWVGVALTMIGLVSLTPVWGIYGAAATATAAYLTVFILLRISVYRAVVRRGAEPITVQNPTLDV